MCLHNRFVFKVGGAEGLVCARALLHPCTAGSEWMSARGRR